ncbi:amino acid oxidase [Methyloprofundus sedimenti]|uniref:Amino acid oxidase n=2 Tax=Methyloprofundus sedimenti TaxID=1420851 RepID=A0A1V8M435_9GAMM|nr:amino acid oxidase [Methyloprofundus sedimenti]
MYLSEYFARQGHEVMLSEKEDNFMQRASYVNQARVHNGYHYPRSMLTALRSRVSLPKFYAEFRDCIDDTFDKYYLISNIQSKISANQFENFCRRIGAVCEPAPHKITCIVDPHYVEAVFTTKEFAFNAEKLMHTMLDRIGDAGVQYHLNQKIQSVREVNGKLLIHAYSLSDEIELEPIAVDEVFNCTYSMINQVINDSGIDMIPLKHELTEIALVKVPDVLKNVGITVMDGPFFSVMPFPARGLHSFSHVRYTPHYEWHDTNSGGYRDAHRHYDLITKKSAWPYMIQDAQRYIPLLSECKYEDSIWEVKTILPSSETSDSRPILYKPNHGLNGFHNIMGGKIDNVYDVIEVIENTGLING